MYDFTRFLKIVGMIIAAISIIILFLIALDKITIYVEDVGVVSKETVNLTIIDEDYIRRYLGGEETIFVVDYDGVKYTLPSVSTGYVRTYHVDDMIPVKVVKYESGYTRLSVDLTAIGGDLVCFSKKLI